MYKLFLCLRYLRSKVFAYFAVLGVALCVWMMLVSVSVMTGILDKIENAAKGLFGDIVIESGGERGLAWYDEFIAKMEAEVPEVDVAGPFILGLGILRVDGDSDFRQHVQIAGIRLPDRAAVTDFEIGLFVQGGQAKPTFNPPLEQAIAAIKRHQQEMRKIVEREFADELAELSPQQQTDVLENLSNLRFAIGGNEFSPERYNLLNRIDNAAWMQARALDYLENAMSSQDDLAQLQERLHQAKANPQATETEIEGIQESIDDLIGMTHMELPDKRVILGLGIQGLSFRTENHETIRYIVPGHRIILSVAPLGKKMSLSDISMNSAKFTVIDDSKTDVSSIDDKLVYIPFDTLQQLNNMHAEYDADDPTKMIVPACCSQIHIKVKDLPNGKKPTEADLRRTASKIKGVWQDFAKQYDRKYPNDPQLQPALHDVGIDTWRQRQIAVVGPIEQQRTLVIVIMSIMSIVAVALIFVILYTIVVQKTREIGVLKAVGASSWGVASLFFAYGAAIGFVGSIIGTVAGYFTTKHINAIQSWADSMFGLRVWDRKSFMFEFIPNEVDWSMAIFILAGSILAGLIGALIPAIRAARMQPVEALRYE